MARKRNRSKRKDYRKGGRVKYAHGGRPSRRDYESGDEYQVALEQWRNDPAHQGESKAPVKPAVSTPVQEPVQQPVQQPAPVQQPPQRQAPFREFDPADRDLINSGSLSAYPTVQGSVTPATTRPRTADDFKEFGRTKGYPQRQIDTTPELFGSTAFEPREVVFDKRTVEAPSKDAVEQSFKDFASTKIEQFGNLTQKDVEDYFDNLSVKDVASAVGKGAVTLAKLPVTVIQKTINLLRGIGADTSDPKVIIELASKAIGEPLLVSQGSAEAREIANIFMNEVESRAKENKSVLQAMPTKFSGVGAGKQFDNQEDPPPDPDAPVGSLGRASDLASAMQTLYGGVGSSFEANRSAYTESGQYDIDREARQAEFDAMRAAKGDSVPRTKEETQQLVAEQRARIGAELAGGTMSPAATTTLSPAVQQAGQLGQAARDIGGGQDTGSTGGTDDTGGVGASGDNLSRQRAIDIIAGEEGSEGPQVPTPTNIDTSLGLTAEDKIQTIDPITGATVGTITDPMSMDLQDATLTQAQQQAMLPAAQMEAAQVGTETLIAGQQGAIGDESLAKAAQVEQVAPIQAATVEIPEGALTQRVVGTLSPNATAIAAQAAGTTLSRVTRAKKQLRNAGISEQAITDLGNDPEALEDRLMDLTEQERGVIGGLPEEALVSNQIDSLLKGMENGEIPAWAKPAVSAVEQMLAQRGLSASTVGRDNLFNAIIQSAVPIAQSNAQAIQQSVAQSREIESREEIFNAQARQQTALQNASNVFQMDMTQFSADQQTALSNSKFLQTVSLTEASNRQQTAIQNAAITAQMNLADADFNQKAQIQNAQAFLGMDMANLNNNQQATILSAQINQQSMLSNQAAQNVARQFNATSENQTQQFMAGLAQQVELTNTAAANSISQFNAQQANAAAATEFQVEADLNKAKAAMETDINRFNAQLDFNRKQWNAQNAQAVEQSNIAWRRQANTINTAASNQVAMQNAMNAFNLNGQSLAFLWQELRDKAAMDFQSVQNLEDRKAQIYAQSLANEGASAANMSDNIRAIGDILTGMFEEADPTQLGSGALS